MHRERATELVSGLTVHQRWGHRRHGRLLGIASKRVSQRREGHAGFFSWLPRSSQDGQSRGTRISSKLLTTSRLGAFVVVSVLTSSSARCDVISFGFIDCVSTARVLREKGRNVDQQIGVQPFTYASEARHEVLLNFDEHS